MPRPMAELSAADLRADLQLRSAVWAAKEALQDALSAAARGHSLEQREAALAMIGPVGRLWADGIGRVPILQAYCAAMDGSVEQREAAE